jgi:hypothetical protein
LPVAEFASAGPVGHIGAVEGNVLGGADHAAQFDQRALFERGNQLGGFVGPDHEIGAGRDSRGGVDLQEGQAVHDVEDGGGSRRVQQLRAHRDPACVGAAEFVHARRLTAISFPDGHLREVSSISAVSGRRWVRGQGCKPTGFDCQLTAVFPAR